MKSRVKTWDEKKTVMDRVIKGIGVVIQAAVRGSTKSGGVGGGVLSKKVR